MTETRPRVYIPTEPLYAPTGEMLSPGAAVDNALLAPPQEQSTLSKAANRLLGTQFGEERFQTWPEKMVRSAATLAGDVLSGEVPVLPPGSRREDVTDEPAPGVDANAPWWKPSRWIAPVAAQPNDKMMERAQDLAGVAMGGGIGGTGKAAAAGEAVLGSGPVRKIKMSKYNQDMETAGILFDQADAWKAARQKPEVAALDPKTLHSTQDTFQDGVGHGGGFKGMNDKPLVARTPDGKMHILDGHHRLEKAAAEGKQLDSYVIDLPGDPGISRPRGGKTLRSGMGDEGAGPVPLNQKGPPWFSAVENALEQTSMGSAPGAQWLATLRNARGVKPEEMAWLGLDDMLAEAQLAGRKVTRAEIQDHIKSHQVELRDVEKSNRSDYDTMDQVEQGVQRQRLADFLDITSAEFAREYPTPRDVREGVNAMLRDFGDEGAANATEYHNYQLPGGENYREHLITMPEAQLRGEKAAEFDRLITEGRGDLAARLTRDLPEGYKSSHWEEPNILAHVRTNDRVIDGKKALHLEEVQSDWHQQGRDKGYKNNLSEAETAELKKLRAKIEDGTMNGDEASRVAELENKKAAYGGVPDAPFKKSWHELALKRMLRRAAEEGYERLSWTPGDAQAARYNLRKSVENVRYDPASKKLIAEDKAGNTAFRKEGVEPDKLADYIGKEAAKKLMEQKLNGKYHELSGQALEIGGEGMRGFYDDILPKALQKIGREHGVKVQRGGVETKPITKTVDDRYSVTGDRNIYSTLDDARKAASEPIFYIDIPQSLRDAAMRKGFPLFSGGKMFVPHQEEDK